MSAKQQVKMKGLGGVEIQPDGFTVWDADGLGGRWTFRAGLGSGVADLHRSLGDEKTRLWVGRKRELLVWLVRTLRADAMLGWVDAVATPTQWEWVKQQGYGLARLPTVEPEDHERLMGRLAKTPLERLVETESCLAVSLLPWGLNQNDLEAGTYAAYEDRGEGLEHCGTLIWTPGAAERALVWIDHEALSHRAEALLAPYREELKSMDRPGVRADLDAYFARERAKRAKRES